MSAELDIDISVGSVRALPVGVTTADLTLLQGVGVLYGWSLRETTGAAVATVEIRDGDQPLGEIGLVASGVNSAWLGPMGVRIANSVILHVVAGSVTGAVYAGFYRY